MKARRIRNIVALWLVLLWVGAGVALAASPTWAADPASGVKVGWVSDNSTLIAATWSGPAIDGKADGKGNLTVTVRHKNGKEYKASGEAELKAGLLEGQVKMTWSDGEAFDAVYVAGRIQKGIWKIADGRVYEGEFQDGQPHGYGIGKDASGKVIHDGQWKNGQPVTPLKAESVMGIPWGASDKVVRDVLMARPKTIRVSYLDGRDGKDRWQYYGGPYADFSDAWIYVHYYEEKMWMVQISWPLKENEVLDRFQTIRQGLQTRYGAPSSEKGKFLDSFVYWELGGPGDGYGVNVQIRPNKIRFVPADRTPETHPFRVYVTYNDQTVAKLLNPPNTKPDGAHKDY